MMEAEPCLSSVTRVQSSKGDAAESQISTLLRLYGRQPGQCSNPMPAISVPDNYKALCAELEKLNTQPSAPMLAVFPSSPQIMNIAPPSIWFTKDDPMPSLTPSSPPSTRDLFQAEDPGADLYAEEDIQLMEYAKERSITWEDLKNRPPLFGGEVLGPWRFSSAEGICRSKRLEYQQAAQPQTTLQVDPQLSPSLPSSPS